MWSQTVAIPSSAKRCTFSLCTIAVRGIQKLYVQTKDPDTGVAYNAVCIGDWLGTTRPPCMVDGKANVDVYKRQIGFCVASTRKGSGRR